MDPPRTEIEKKTRCWKQLKISAIGELSDAGVPDVLLLRLISMLRHEGSSKFKAQSNSSELDPSQVAKAVEHRWAGEDRSQQLARRPSIDPIDQSIARSD